MNAWTCVHIVICFVTNLFITSKQWYLFNTIDSKIYFACEYMVDMQAHATKWISDSFWINRNHFYPKKKKKANKFPLWSKSGFDDENEQRNVRTYVGRVRKVGGVGCLLSVCASELLQTTFKQILKNRHNLSHWALKHRHYLNLHNLRCNEYYIHIHVSKYTW